MSNYNLVIDTSNFKPFDINPALQVLHDYRDAYYRLEDQMNKIAEEKGEYVLPETSKYKGVMDRYNTDYDAAVADFSKGMNLQNAQNIRNLRRRYSSEISPIRTMVQNYNKYNDKVTALGPDAIIGNVYGVDDFYGGVTPAIDYRSAKQVELDAMKYFSGINNALTQDPEFRKILGGQYYLQTQKGGLDSGAALQAALVEYNNRTNGQHSEAVQNLLGHMQNVMNSEAVDNFSDDAKKQVWNKIASGLVASIEAPKYSQVTNRGYETPSDRRQMAYQEAQMAKSGYIYNPSTGKYEYDEEAAATAGGTARTATLPDGSTWNYDPKKKQWTSTSSKWDGIPRTSAQLIAEERKQLADKKKQDQLTDKELGEVGKRTEEQYLELGRKVAPLNYRGWDSESNWEYDSDDSNYYYSRSAWTGGSNSKLSDSAKEKIKPEVKMDILSKLKEQNPGLNIGWEDLDIYEDNDWLSNNHYRVVIKGTGERGIYQGTTRTETPVSTTRGESPADSTSVQRKDSTTVVRKPNAWG